MFKEGVHTEDKNHSTPSPTRQPAPRSPATIPCPTAFCSLITTCLHASAVQARQRGGPTPAKPHVKPAQQGEKPHAPCFNTHAEVAAGVGAAVGAGAIWHVVPCVVDRQMSPSQQVCPPVQSAPGSLEQAVGGIGVGLEDGGGIVGVVHHRPQQRTLGRQAGRGCVEEWLQQV